MTDINRKAALERRRLLRILKDLGLPEASWKTLEPIITNVSWMKAKLDEIFSKFEKTKAGIEEYKASL